MDIEPKNSVSDQAGLPQALGFQRGEEAEVRSLDEIRATLDTRGAREPSLLARDLAASRGRRAVNEEPRRAQRRDPKSAGDQHKPGRVVPK